MSSETATTERVVVKIDADVGHHGPEPVLEIVPGPRPYLWIGDEERCYGTVSGRELTKLRKALSS